MDHLDFIVDSYPTLQNFYFIINSSIDVEDETPIAKDTYKINWRLVKPHPNIKHNTGKHA
jgi:hypothetical protein